MHRILCMHINPPSELINATILQINDTKKIDKWNKEKYCFNGPGLKSSDNLRANKSVLGVL